MQQSLINPVAKNRYEFADGLRGLAALWVVFYHLYHGNHVELLTEYIGKGLSTIIFEYGNLGVPVFFVLSGFVMAVTTNHKVMGTIQSANFMLRRLIRLSPPYYFGILVSLILIYVKIHTVEPNIQFPDTTTIVAHLLYLQGFFQRPPINIVYWTLCYEIQFYLVFSIIIYLASRFASFTIQHHVVLIVATLPGLLWLTFAEYAPDWQAYASQHLLFIYYWYAFSAGALVGWLINKPEAAIFRNYTVLFFSWLLVIGVFKHDLFALTAGTAAIALQIALYKNKMNSWLNYRPIQILGLISYSLYLIHNNLLGIVARVVRKFLVPGIVTDITVAGLATLACVLAALLMYQFIEKPVIKLSQRIKY